MFLYFDETVIPCEIQTRVSYWVILSFTILAFLQTLITFIICIVIIIKKKKAREPSSFIITHFIFVKMVSIVFASVRTYFTASCSKFSLTECLIHGGIQKSLWYVTNLNIILIFVDLCLKNIQKSIYDTLFKRCSIVFLLLVWILPICCTTIVDIPFEVIALLNLPHKIFCQRLKLRSLTANLIANILMELLIPSIIVAISGVYAHKMVGKKINETRKKVDMDDAVTQEVLRSLEEKRKRSIIILIIISVVNFLPPLGSLASLVGAYGPFQSGIHQNSFRIASKITSALFIVYTMIGCPIIIFSNRILAQEFKKILIDPVKNLVKRK